ncbi:hypothetical protein FB561_6860 [Kribbella amoyensis]|uniref:Uncharacterized protein n=1 Tax=Kribbella amoyensis TaxID=996641 RepID=A0A561B978_9ACTN|nr:hypothetical protein [Kribbella amoyensis]TWD75420.1 hypothetical protein FB561_6860 [Kribbella amoyensis]
MWLFLRRRLIMWAVLAIAVPLLEWLLGKVSTALRERRGESTVTKGLDTARSGLRTLRGKGR